MTDYSKESDISLSQNLKLLGRELIRIKSSTPSMPSTPKDFVHIAAADSRIDEIKAEQVSIGEELLKRDEVRQKAQLKRTEQTAIEGAEKAAVLLERLPEFAAKVAIAFEMLGSEYAELLSISEDVRKTNMVLMGQNRPSCCKAAVRIEPNNLHRVMKESFRSSFGANTANVFLPQRTLNFNIVDAVAKIEQECGTTPAKYWRPSNE